MQQQMATLLLLKLLLISSCASVPQDVKVYQGTHEHASIERLKGTETVYCVDPAFNNYFCMSKDDLETLLMCPVK